MNVNEARAIGHEQAKGDNKLVLIANGDGGFEVARSADSYVIGEILSDNTWSFYSHYGIPITKEEAAQIEKILLTLNP